MSDLCSFTSLSFIFRFLPVFLILYHIVPPKAKNAVALLGSFLFYAAGEPLYVFLLLGLSVLNALLAEGSFRAASGGDGSKKRGIFILAAVILDLLVLLAFKVLQTAKITAMPLGISFYVFKMISFQIDILREKIVKKPGILRSVLYFSLFPQIQQGPIMRFEDGGFFEEKHFSLKDLEEGLKIFAIGLAMKTILADRIGILWNDLSMYGYESISTPLSWLGAFAYSLELYLDFYGYSLMASGILIMMGCKFIRNFDHPYASTSVSEFYRRWHMTLGFFFRDYLYIPLGGSRRGKARTVVNLLIVWLLTGLWHGNGWNFLIWGVLLGIFVVAEKLFLGKILDKSRILGHLYVILLIPVTWVVFAIGNLRDLWTYLSRMFPFGKSAGHVDPLDFLEYIKDYGLLFLFGILLCLPVTEKLFLKYRKSAVMILLLSVLFWIGIYYAASGANNPFMYLRF
ncbi:MAG: MBOAT family protein [Lachnospiraceae bacterium]|nr:MBOAT family protein [Lachnospiraceae bacterium]